MTEDTLDHILESDTVGIQFTLGVDTFLALSMDSEVTTKFLYSIEIEPITTEVHIIEPDKIEELIQSIHEEYVIDLDEWFDSDMTSREFSGTFDEMLNSISLEMPGDQNVI